MEEHPTVKLERLKHAYAWALKTETRLSLEYQQAREQVARLAQEIRELQSCQ
ncbi:MAG TPA: hypothetical protein VM531_08685 [Sphingomicrobium sp.]|jgi:hypothetical protein|nr:hypothetical protein [Sphingomicrobium sp.]